MKPTILVVTTLAATGVLPLAAQAPDRSGPPELGPPPRLSLPAVQEQTLPNGLRVLLMEKHDVPVVQINVMVMAGSAMDPADRGGLATLTADMLDEGAGGRDALAFADAVDFLGARLFTSAGNHTTVARLFTPLSKLDEALPLLADVVLRPSFPADELDRKRKSRLTTLLQWHDEPSAVANVLFDRAIYGTAHPYGRPSIGTEESIRGTTVDDLRQFHRRYFRPNNSTVIVVGDVTMEAVLPKLRSAFGAWERGSVPSANWPQAPQVTGREILLVDKPGAAQSEIRIGNVGVPRSTDDYYAIQVMNTILGGAFTSRLNQNLRERNGYTYGAGSSFSMSVLAGPFRASSAVQTDATDKALREFFNEFTGMQQAIPGDELQRAKNYVALRYPNNFQSVGSIASNLDDIPTFGLPSDYFNRYVDRILGVTGAQVERVARQHITPGRMVIVVVGDREKIEAGIRALNLGPVRTMTIEDVLGPKPTVE